MACVPAVPAIALRCAVTCDITLATPTPPLRGRRLVGAGQRRSNASANAQLNSLPGKPAGEAAGADSRRTDWPVRVQTYDWDIMLNGTVGGLYAMNCVESLLWGKQNMSVSSARWRLGADRARARARRD